MSDALSTWDQRIADAQDDNDRRRLLAELGGWRARNLTDIHALRQAAYGMARLYAMLNEGDAAIREAQSLVSLCQTHPPASAEDLRSAQSFARSLGGVGVVGPRSERQPRKKKARSERRVDTPRGDVLDAVREAAGAGRLDEARGMLRGKKGPEVAVLRAYVWLEEIRTGPEQAQRTQLAKLSGWLRREARLPALPKTETPAAVQGPLAEFLGRPVPDRRRARIRLLEEAVEKQPERAGELALLALEHHVTNEGPDVPAPWLVGLVARAEVLGQGEAVRERVEALRADGSVVAMAYGEWPYGSATTLYDTFTFPTQFVGLRRGVLSRGGEPDDRKIWTLQYRTEIGTARVAFAGPSDEPYPADYAPKVAERLKMLSASAPLVAPGPGNAPLREAAEAVGIRTVDSEDVADWIAALGPGEPDTKSERKRPAAAPPVAKAAPAPKEEGPSPETVLLASLTADPLDEEALKASLERFERLHHAFVALRGADASPAAQLAFLRAADALAPAKARLPEGISIAVRLAAEGEDAAKALLVEAPSSVRFGGVGIERVLEAATALTEAGWRVERAVRGAMARERRQDPVLSALGDSERAIWRLLVRRGDAEASLLVLAEDSPEGRAAVPRLMRRSTALVLPEAALEWYAGVEGPPASASVADGVSALG